MDFFDTESGLAASSLTNFNPTLQIVLIVVGVFTSLAFLAVFLHGPSPRGIKAFSGVFALAAFIGLVIAPTAGAITGSNDAVNKDAHIIQEFANTELNVTLTDETTRELASKGIALDSNGNSFLWTKGSSDPDHYYLVYVGQGIPNKIYQQSAPQTTDPAQGTGEGAPADGAGTVTE